MRMAIDPFKVIRKTLVRVKNKRVPKRAVSVDYDEEVDLFNKSKNVF